MDECTHYMRVATVAHLLNSGRGRRPDQVCQLQVLHLRNQNDTAPMGSLCTTNAVIDARDVDQQVHTGRHP